MIIKKMSSVFFLFVVVLSLSLFIGSVSIAKEITTISNVTGKFQSLESDFTAIGNNIVQNLELATYMNAKGVYAGNLNLLAPGSAIEARMSIARKKGVDRLAILVFNFPEPAKKSFWRKSVTYMQFTFDIYNVNTQSVDFHYEKRFEYSDVRRLISTLENVLLHALRVKMHKVGRIIKREGGIVYFNLGRTAGVKRNDIFRVFREGQELKDDLGNTFGQLKEKVGVLRVIEAETFYSTAEIIVGRILVKTGDFVEKPSNKVKKRETPFYMGRVLSVLEDDVAISIGSNVGVREGAYYAVYRDLKQINQTEAFRKRVGAIRVHEVSDNISKGKIALSSDYALSKIMVEEGNIVEEIESPRKNTLALSQNILHVNSDDSDSVTQVMYQIDSKNVINLSYRLRCGWASDTEEALFGGGILTSIGYSSNFFMGIEVIYLDGAATNLLLSVDVPTPVFKFAKLTLDCGYLIGADKVGDDEVDLDGLNLAVGVKVPFDWSKKR